MSSTVKISIQTNAPQIAASLRKCPSVIAAALQHTMDAQNQLTIGHIVNAYMSRRGPTSLGVRTSRLRSSLRAAPAQMEGNKLISSIGTNVVYAGVHEFGFSGTEQVRAHIRRRYVNGHVTRELVDKRTGKTRFSTRKTKEEKTAQVRAHTRKVNIPARAPIRRGISDRAASYTKALEMTLAEVLHGL